MLTALYERSFYLLEPLSNLGHSHEQVAEAWVEVAGFAPASRSRSLTQVYAVEVIYASDVSGFRLMTRFNA